MSLRRVLKKVICVFLIMTFMFSLAGCGAAGEQKTAEAQKTTANQKTPELDKEAQKAKDASAKTGFSWDMAKGTKIRILFDQHPYAEAIISNLPKFEEKTGIKVEYTVTPEENYFDKVTTSLNSRSGDSDIFMTGVYQIWEYAPPEYMQDIDEFAKDSNLTAPEYDMKDFFPTILNSLRWDLKAGHKMGEGPLWALPMGFETEDMAYNKKLFDEKGLKPPKTTKELLEVTKKLNEFNGSGSYGAALRGSKGWGTLITSYISNYFNYGATDFAIENGKLVSKVNTKEAVEATEMWVKLIKEGGSPTWATYSWYQAGADLGAKKAAILLDANNNGFYQNVKGNSKEAGNLAWARIPLPEDKDKFNANLWTWALSMNKSSKNKQGAWIFLQYFTGKEYQNWAAVNAKVINTPRASTFDLPEYQKILNQAEGYIDTFKATVDNTRLLYTPQPHFFEVSTEWCATLQDLVSGKYKSTQEGMDALKKKLDEIVSDVKVN